MLADIAYIALFAALWALWGSRTSDVPGGAVIASGAMALLVCAT